MHGSSITLIEFIIYHALIPVKIYFQNYADRINYKNYFIFIFFFVSSFDTLHSHLSLIVLIVVGEYIIMILIYTL